MKGAIFVIAALALFAVAHSDTIEDSVAILGPEDHDHDPAHEEDHIDDPRPKATKAAKGIMAAAKKKAAKVKAKAGKTFVHVQKKAVGQAKVLADKIHELE